MFVRIDRSMFTQMYRKNCEKMQRRDTYTTLQLLPIQEKMLQKHFSTNQYRKVLSLSNPPKNTYAEVKLT